MPHRSRARYGSLPEERIFMNKPSRLIAALVDSRVLNWKSLAAVAAVLCAGAGCAIDAGETDDSVSEEETSEISSEIGRGYKVYDCSRTLVRKIHDAYGVLLDTTGPDFGDYRACLQGAALVENNCKTGHHIADLLKKWEWTKVTCYDSRTANAEAEVGISGEEMKVDRTFLAKSNATRIASVMAHELMHNRGFRHKQNDFGSTLYRNTVPEQAEACVLSGKPNPWPLSSTPPAQTCTPTPKTCTAPKSHCCEPLPGGSCAFCATSMAACP